MISQANIRADTPMGANLVPGGATFRVWAPRAVAVYLEGNFGGVALETKSQDALMLRDARGHWTGFVAGARDGDLYRYYVVGAGSEGYKRDPFARELATDAPFPDSSCVVRANDYPWHDRAFVTPDFSDMIVYQLHVGTYVAAASGATSTFLDVAGRVDHLASLGINVLQPLPVDEAEGDPSMGYNSADYFSPDSVYVVHDASALKRYAATINRLLAAKGAAGIEAADIRSGPAQLKAMIDVCHVYGIAVVFDVVYNHAGGFFGDDRGLYFWDRARNGDNNQSLYFTDRGWAGGLSFALWNDDVRQFLIDSARYYLEEFHVDGFRYDEISALLAMNGDSGWSFCRDLTGTVRYLRPRALQNAEHWPVDPAVVAEAASGGAGFDVLQHDALRNAVRGALAQAASGSAASVDLDAVAGSLYPAGFAHGWQAVTCIENHDLVRAGRERRIPSLADGVDARSWYARSRARVATALLFAAPGIPQLFMGQEFLEYKPWTEDPRSPYLISWPSGGPGDRVQLDFLRFLTDLIRVRWDLAALRGDRLRVFHVHNANRVIALHRWLEGKGEDVVVAATLSETTWYGYQLGFPSAGRWREVFNSDTYDVFPNPNVAGNQGQIEATPTPLHGFEASSPIVIPANGAVIFKRG